MNPLVEPHSNAVFQSGVPVFDGFDVLDDLAADAAFFARLAHGGDLGILALIDKSLGKLPSMLRPNRNDDDLDLIALAPEYYSDRRRLIAHRDLDCWRFQRPGPSRCAGRHQRLPPRSRALDS